MNKKHAFGDGYPICARVTDADTPLIVYCKAMKAAYLLDARQDCSVPIEVMISVGEKEFKQREGIAEKGKVQVKNKIQIQ